MRKAVLYQRIYRWSLKKYREHSGTEPYIPKDQLTRHALLRYIERIDGYDIEAARSKILTKEVVSKINDLGGNAKFVIGDIQYTVKNYRIVSIAKPSYLTPTERTLDGSVRRWSF